MKPVILCDVDGVVLDWMSRFPYFLEKKGIDPARAIRAYASGEFLTFQDIIGGTMGAEEAEALAIEYQESKYMSYLTAYKDALLMVNALKHKYDFVAVTAVLNSEATRTNRQANLDFWYAGAFSKVHCVGLGGSKYDVLCKYDRTVFIDDSPSHIAEAQAAGHIGIRLKVDSRPDTGLYPIAKDWYDLSNMIQTILPTG